MLQNELKVELFFQLGKEAAPEAGLSVFLCSGVFSLSLLCVPTGEKSSNPQAPKASPDVSEQFGKPRTPAIPCRIS